ncbi:MAG: hypothetical protein HOI95_02625 [Chromatiales bacterium]|nr:hypothetical protein [Chromatiales bacterium]
MSGSEIAPVESRTRANPDAREVAVPTSPQAPKLDEHPSLSAGCGQAAPSELPSTIAVNGRKRRFLLALPTTYLSTQPHPLVFAFHGRTNSNAKARGYFRLERNATVPTLFVYPSGLKRGKSYSWSNPRDSLKTVRDLTLFDQLLRLIGDKYCVNRDRVYVVGHSLGAWFANTLGCIRGSTVRAVASLGGGMARGPCTGRVAALLMHNPKDRLAAFSSGVRVRDHFLGHAGLTMVAPSAAHGPLACRKYVGTDVRNPVVWCPHQIDVTWRGKYYPHQWPRVAGRTIMQFLETLPAHRAT